MAGIGLIVLIMSFSLVLLNSVYAETTEQQVTLSGDLQNNPVAQDILEKIEKSKRWIAKIEQRNFESLEKQKELEEKRAEVLKILQDDLEKWEKLWEYNTFDMMLQRALENNPVKDTPLIYDHPLKFTASKISAGHNALSKILQEGGGPEEARDAFVNAAKITRGEMFATNILFNVIHNNAYYNQQILFSPDGQFNLDLSGEKLAKYYLDYRTNPQYLQANPYDEISWEDIGKNDPDTECRLGYVLVYRTHVDDYICTTTYTAEMWIRHDMGTLVNSVFSATPDVDIERLQNDRIIEKVKNLNSKINSMQQYYETKLDDTYLEYDSLFFKMNKDQEKEERQIIEKFGIISSAYQDVVNGQLSDIKEKYLELEKSTLHEKSRILKIMEQQHQMTLNDFIKNYESDSEIKISWTLNRPLFEAVISLS